MRSKISFVFAVGIISIFGTICSLVIILFPRALVPADIVPIIIVPKQVIAALPVRLEIPEIHVDAFVEYLALTPTGAMDVPKGPDDVAWFDLGPRPGSTGSAVIAGHEGWKDNVPAVFDDLYKLKVGDQIYVEDGVGSTTIFVVKNFRYTARMRTLQMCSVQLTDCRT